MRGSARNGAAAPSIDPSAQLVLCAGAPDTPELAAEIARLVQHVQATRGGVVVIEAAERSGSLITANFALEQGREIFAVPGSPLDPRARGANRLIRDGATLTESAADVLAALAPILGRAFEEAPSTVLGNGSGELRVDDEAHLRSQIEQKLGPAPVETDELVRQSGASPAAILTILLELELAGRVVRHPGGKVSLG